MAIHYDLSYNCISVLFWDLKSLKTPKSSLFCDVTPRRLVAFLPTFRDNLWDPSLRISRIVDIHKFTLHNTQEERRFYLLSVGSLKSSTEGVRFLFYGVYSCTTLHGVTQHTSVIFISLFVFRQAADCISDHQKVYRSFDLHYGR